MPFRFLRDIRRHSGGSEEAVLLSALSIERRTARLKNRCRLVACSTKTAVFTPFRFPCSTGRGRHGGGGGEHGPEKGTMGDLPKSTWRAIGALPFTLITARHAIKHVLDDAAS